MVQKAGAERRERRCKKAGHKEYGFRHVTDDQIRWATNMNKQRNTKPDGVCSAKDLRQILAFGIKFNALPKDLKVEQLRHVLRQVVGEQRVVPLKAMKTTKTPMRAMKVLMKVPKLKRKSTLKQATLPADMVAAATRRPLKNAQQTATGAQRSDKKIVVRRLVRKASGLAACYHGRVNDVPDYRPIWHRKRIVTVPASPQRVPRPFVFASPTKALAAATSPPLPVKHDLTPSQK